MSDVLDEIERLEVELHEARRRIRVLETALQAIRELSYA